MPLIVPVTLSVYDRPRITGWLPEIVKHDVPKSGQEAISVVSCHNSSVADISFPKSDMLTTQFAVVPE